MSVQQIKNFDAERLDMDELVHLAALARALREEYESHGLDEPDWLGISMKEIKREIHTRNADTLEKRLREVNLRIESLKTPAQKKIELQKQKVALEKQLAEVG